MKKKLEKLEAWKEKNWDKFYPNITGLLASIIMLLSIVLFGQGNYDAATFGALLALYTQRESKK